MTGGERGDILNPAMDRPEVKADMPASAGRRWPGPVRSSASQQRLLGFVDSGLPEGDPLPPLPEGCFALVPLDEAAAPLVAAVREFRPHVILTYDENGGYPHPDHIKTHQVAVEAFEAAADPDRYPEAGEPWQPLKLYYFVTFHQAKYVALHEEMLRRGLDSPYEDLRAGEERARKREELASGARDHHQDRCRRLLRDPRPGAAGARHPDRPEERVVRLPARRPARRVADRGLSSC